ncbi:MAG TPA: DNA repair protein RadA [bacterium]|nr:DNA repair protein RadA [bacterium]
MKSRAVYVCQECGYQAPKWLGRCPDCGQWNTLVEERQISPERQDHKLRPPPASESPVLLGDIDLARYPRLATGIAELDRVLGGGVVPGSVVLVGGDPGIGKSTLLLQAAGGLARQGTVLYVTGEESLEQVRGRGDRLGLRGEGLLLLYETCLQRVLERIQERQLSAIVIDSIQTLYSLDLDSAPGSVSQVRESAAHLVELAKKSRVPVFLIGHVTKDGSLAGPRVLEHMVDTVLYFEGDKTHLFRVLRAVKNRFGSTNEVGIFEMVSGGLREVLNPSVAFLAERPAGASGSVVTASVEGSRPLLLEIQALVSPTNTAVPRRAVTGVDPQRVAILIAVLEKRLGYPLQGSDIFINVAGGLRVEEPGVDLGVAMALCSSFHDLEIDPHTVVLGEVGLAGEVRAVTQLQTRLREAEKLGFQRAVIPARHPEEGVFSLEVREARTVKEATEMLFQNSKGNPG